MASKKGNAPILIRRATQVEEAGHHGGAWKVAYADFVTAMMAFFLLMWLLNATTEQQRQGLADYFNPTIVRSSSGAGDAGLGEGDEADIPAESIANAQPDPLTELNSHIKSQLEGVGGESMQMHNLLRHVVTRVTDEGLVIELSDLVDEPLFRAETAEPTAAMRELGKILTRVLSGTRNQIAIGGHVRSYPAVLANSPIWDFSNDRAHAVRKILEGASLPAKRIQRVTGFADRHSQASDPGAETNNRIEVILLK